LKSIHALSSFHPSIFSRIHPHYIIATPTYNRHISWTTPNTYHM
jgi:hypothetical protein